MVLASSEGDGKMDIQKWDSLAIDSAVPAVGIGLSDGPGAHQRMARPHYGPETAKMYHGAGVYFKQDASRTKDLQKKKGERKRRGR